MAGRSPTQLHVKFVDSPRAYRGRLRVGDGPGSAVHAATFLRKGEIVLDSALLESPGELTRILAHELFHFVWHRLGNAARRSFEELVARECRQRARGELGWSSEWRKKALTARDRLQRTRQWREYVCESFCDTAAWLYAGVRRHSEFTLPADYRGRRRAWFCSTGAGSRMSV